MKGIFNRKQPRRRRQSRGSRREVRFAPPPKPVKAIQIVTNLRKKAKLSTWKLAELAYVDHRYLYRLESGEKTHPSRGVLIRLGRALVNYSKLFDEDDVDRILKAGGYPPAPLDDE